MKSVSSGVDARSDVFAFCVSLWEALSTVRPFPEQSVRSHLQAVQQGRVSDPPPGTIARRIQTVLRLGLSPRPEDRPDSISLLLRQLRRARRRRSIPAALGLGTLLVAALPWWGAATKPDPPTRCASSAIVGEDIVLDLGRFESSLRDHLAGVGTLVATEARTKAVELHTAIELTAERTCHDQAAGRLSAVEARARAHCLRALEIQLHTVVTRAMQTPDALAILLEIPAPATCETWSNELEDQALAGRLRTAEEQALADALERVAIGNQMDDDPQALEATIRPLLDRASEGEDRWLHAKTLHLAAKVSTDDQWSRASSLRASELFAHTGDPVGRISALLLVILSAFDDNEIEPHVGDHYQQARALYERLEDPDSIPSVGIWLDIIEMMLTFYRGDHAGARTIAERVRRDSPKVSPMTTYFVVDWLTVFDELGGNYEDLVRSSKTLIDWLVGRGVFARSYLAEAELPLSLSLAQLGRPDEAEHAWNQAKTIMESMHPGEPMPADPLLIRARIDATKHSPPSSRSERHSSTSSSPHPPPMSRSVDPPGSSSPP
ncbi:MAG: protein kinase [Myxococcota bacterium]